MSEEMITIPYPHYEELQKRDDKLSALEAGGVDNWAGYDDAMASIWEEEDKDD